MATCDSFQPVVLLTDLMDSTVGQTKIFCSSRTEEQISSPTHLFEMEQTEPLNLCLAGGILKDSLNPEYCSKEEEWEDFSEQSDEDVIFVKSYKVNRAKLAKRPYDQNISSQSGPRRNPIRKARDAKRFQEYTDVDVLDNAFFEESEDKENVRVVSEKCVMKNEDLEDWKIENVAKKPRQRRRVFAKTMQKVGRKRKINKIEIEEKRVPLTDLAPLIEANLLLVKDYIRDLRIVKPLLTEREHEREEVMKKGVNLFKQQVVLTSVAKDINSDALPQLINEWIGC